MDLRGRKWQEYGHNEELHNLYTSLNIIWTTKWRSIRWTGHGRDEKFIQNFGQKTWREEFHTRQGIFRL